jgi:transposase
VPDSKKLMARGKSNKLAVTAIARELSAFLWAIAKHQQPMAKL